MLVLHSQPLKTSRNIILFIFYVVVQSCSPHPIDREHSQGQISSRGMVVTGHALATQVGLDVLNAGGNAYDAAIAVHYALSVVYPVAGNIGGGGFLVYRNANGEIGSLDFRETAPLNVSQEIFLDSIGNVKKGITSLGHLACGIPGSVAGMDELYHKLGTLPFAKLIQPAIDLATDGYRLTRLGAAELNNNRDNFLAANAGDIFLTNKTWHEGDTIRFTDLASTLSRIRDLGKAGFYEGATAAMIVAEMTTGHGIITHEDLKKYRAVWREPIQAKFKNYNIISMPPPSSGGIALAQLVKGSTAFDFGALAQNSPRKIHIMTELMRRVYADRATYLGDPDFYNVPVTMLLDSAYIAERMSTIDTHKATPSSNIKQGKVDHIESFQTTHYSITDQWGNAVSVTTTLNNYFGSYVMVDGAGFFLNNEMDDFSVKPGIPNQFGLVGAMANSIEPGKRMLSSMSPTIIEKNGQLSMVLGTPGGSTIITNVFQVFMNVAAYGMTMQEAVDAKKMHAQWLPDEVILEEGMLDDLRLKELEAYGHHLRTIPQIGRFGAIMLREDQTYEGAADITRSGDGTALGQ